MNARVREISSSCFYFISFNRIAGTSAGLFATGILTLEKLEILESAEP